MKKSTFPRANSFYRAKSTFYHRKSTKITVKIAFGNFTSDIVLNFTVALLNIQEGQGQQIKMFG